MDEIRTARAHMLQRKQRLEALIAKRISNLQYLKKFHEGDHYWMCVALMSKSDMQEYIAKTVPPQRTVGYFVLGVSLSKLYESTTVPSVPRSRNASIFAPCPIAPPSSSAPASTSCTPPACVRYSDLPRHFPSAEAVARFIRGLTQLFEEFEFHFAASPGLQSMRYVMARSSPCMYPNLFTPQGQGAPSSGGEGQGGGRGSAITSPAPPGNNSTSGGASAGAGAGVNAASTASNPTASSGAEGGSHPIPKPTLHKYNSDVVSEFLLSPPSLPFDADYCEVLASLCDVLRLCYDALGDPHCYSGHVSTYDSIVKFDGKVKHHVINLIAKELTDFASEAAEDELVALRTGTSSGVPAASR